jgi:enoyl-CoA hydratase
MTMDTEPRALGQLTIVPRDAVTILRIDRPEKLNALTAAFWGDLQVVLEQLRHDRRTRVIILTGAGDKAFCAGGDINDFAKLTTLAHKRAFQTDAMRGFAALENCPLPVIAAVNGLALGGGCELTLACDIVIASERAQFGMPEAALGLVPGYGVLRAPDVIGRQLTKLMVMAGERLTASQALAAGLVQQVVSHTALLDTALDLAARIAANSSLAHSMGKQLVNRSINRAEFDYSVEALTVLQASDDAREGIAAFQEKRRPRFSLPSD